MIPEDASREIHVLHVDDDPAVLDLVAEFLDSDTYEIEVHGETDPTATLSRLEETDFDCVVSDYNMPELDGVSLCQRVRDQYPMLPFVLFTSANSEDLITEAFESGVSDYTQKKPGLQQYELLGNRIENLVSRHRAQRRLAQTGDSEGTPLRDQ